MKLEERKLCKGVHTQAKVNKDKSHLENGSIVLLRHLRRHSLLIVAASTGYVCVDSCPCHIHTSTAQKQMVRTAIISVFVSYFNTI